jgi:catechol 2,3-dioxygenase-like lactoylglutathione lyase family enzyme
VTRSSSSTKVSDQLPSTPQSNAFPALTFEGVTLAVRDIDKSVAFYTKILGFKVLFYEGSFKARLRSENGTILSLFSVGICDSFRKEAKAKTEELAPPLPFHLEFWAEDIDYLYHHVIHSGYRMSEPSLGPWEGRSSFLKDPDGYTLQIHG